MIQALVFDFDGLILDTESALIAAYADLHAAHGVSFDHDQFLCCVGHADIEFDPLQAFGRHADRAALEDQRRAFNRARDLDLPIMPGITDLIATAKAQGLHVGLASNSPRRHCESHLNRLGLLTRFDFLACRDDVTLPKPDPDLYHLVLARWGLRGDQAIAFEDSHPGSLAAKRAHLWCVAVPGPSTRHHDFKHVDLVVPTLADCTLDNLTARLPP